MFLDFAKIQFLKAIHNPCEVVGQFERVFRFCKNTIFESNSQLVALSIKRCCVFRFCKNTIFESNSQLSSIDAESEIRF